ncbi:MAG: hypothetical protein Q8P22_05890 [Chloroflexota bacterium]|nr:hypothetical protein [Chloroflexota bacterium]
MSTATYVLEVDFDDTWVIGDSAAFSHAQANITNDLVALHSRRGLAPAASLFGQLQSGQLTVELNNDVGKYSPNNSGSVLAGLINPGHWVRLRTTAVDGGAYARTLWGGRLLNIKAAGTAKGNTSFATLTAIGELGWFGKRVIQEMLATNGAGGDVFTETLKAITGRTTFPNHTIDGGLTTFTAFSAEGRQAYAALYSICLAEAGFLYEDTEGKMGFKQRHARLQDAGSIASQATLSDAVGAALSYGSIKQIDSSDVGMIYNETAAAYQRLTVGAIAVLWTLSESGANSPAIRVGESRTFYAQYPNPASATNAVKVSAWETSVATTDYTANAAADGSGANHTADVGVVVVKSAGFLKITLTNNAAVVVYITLLQARGAPFTADDPVRFVSEDAASQTAYGERRFPIEPSLSPWASGLGEAQEWCLWQLATYKDQFQMFDCEVLGNRSEGTLQTVCNLDLDDRVTVVANGQSQLGVSSLDCFVEAIEHKIDRKKMHQTRYVLSETTPTGGWWTWGYAKWGTTTRWAWGYSQWGTAIMWEWGYSQWGTTTRWGI